MDAPFLVEAQAEGTLAGVGRWHLYDGASPSVTYEWKVHTTKAWMNALAPIARSVFVWNHNVLMRRGARGLAARLGAELLAETYV